MSYLNTFITGGILCVIGQILIDKTKLTSAKILVLYVTVGVILTGIGLYEPIVQWAGAGATVPLTGFGYSLAKGVMKDIDSLGFLGIFTGGLKATAAGVCAAVFFSFVASLFCRAKAK